MGSATERHRVVGIIDDDEGIRTAFARLLSCGGYETVVFESADAYLSAGCPITDCLVVDVNMPGMNGLDLTRQLLRMGLRVPVVIVSVDAEKLHDAAIDAGAVCAIPKLAARSRLLDAVSAILQCKPS